MKYIRPFFEGKNRMIQILFLLVFVLAGTIVFSALGQLIAYAVYHTMNMYDASNPAGFIRITQAFGSVGMFLAPALLFAFCQDGKLLSYNDARQKPYYLLVNITLVLSIVIIPLIAAIAQWNESLQLPQSLSRLNEWMRHLDEEASSIMTILTFNHTYGTLIANLFVMALLPALCEEFIFRGTIQQFIFKWSNKPHLAIWVTAVLFSIIHFQFSGFVPRMLLGAYLGYLFYWSRSIWLPFLAHFLHNALSLIIEYTFQGRGIYVDQMNYTEIRGAMPLTVTCGILTAMSLVFMWRVQKEIHYGEDKKL